MSQHNQSSGAQIVAAFFSGGLMSAGIAISQMIDPVKVINFLDVVDHWDPTLLVVMASALMTYAIGYALLKRQRKPLLDKHFHLPERTKLDKGLVFGALLFGLGWGIVGYCPGPAISALHLGAAGNWGFVVAMVVGFAIAHFKPLNG